MIRAEREYKREQRAVKTLKADVEALSDKKCHACGQEIKGGKHQEMLDEKIDKMTDAQEQYEKITLTDFMKKIKPKKIKIL